MTEKYTFEFNDGYQSARITFTNKISLEEQVKELNQYLQVFIKNLKSKAMEQGEIID